ncbi:MAG: hypothetical protein KC415_06715 [Anaerolineales bacterium]|nr:hypothetical protein [Anaerolineales bacterium]MCB8991672.1 hypothetical protein [Ardenticatenaceae bacterium]MCB9005564.1 hypothetical protein [Ardenticatenaceae bacterium]
MTTLLKKAFAQAEQLPEWEQDALAAFILEEIATSQQWSRDAKKKAKELAGEQLRNTLIPNYAKVFSHQ